MVANKEDVDNPMKYLNGNPDNMANSCERKKYNVFNFDQSHM